MVGHVRQHRSTAQVCEDQQRLAAVAGTRLGHRQRDARRVPAWATQRRPAVRRRRWPRSPFGFSSRRASAPLASVPSAVISDGGNCGAARSQKRRGSRAGNGAYRSTRDDRRSGRAGRLVAGQDERAQVRAHQGQAEAEHQAEDPADGDVARHQRRRRRGVLRGRGDQLRCSRRRPTAPCSSRPPRRRPAGPRWPGRPAGRAARPRSGCRSARSASLIWTTRLFDCAVAVLARSVAWLASVVSRALASVAALGQVDLGDRVGPAYGLVGGRAVDGDQVGVVGDSLDPGHAGQRLDRRRPSVGICRTWRPHAGSPGWPSRGPASRPAGRGRAGRSCPYRWAACRPGPAVRPGRSPPGWTRSSARSATARTPRRRRCPTGCSR